MGQAMQAACVKKPLFVTCECQQEVVMLRLPSWMPNVHLTRQSSEGADRLASF